MCVKLENEKSMTMPTHRLLEKDLCTILIPTHSSYLDICEIFLRLLQKNWPDCPYRIVLAVIGKDVRIDEKQLNVGDDLRVEYRYCDADSTLPACLIDAVNAYPSEYYASFLGDAFIMSKVDSERFSDLLDVIKRKRIEYCNLRPITPMARIRKVPNVADGVPLRYANTHDRYSISFPAFIATGKFIKQEFIGEDGKPITDLDFEKRYLTIANGLGEGRYISGSAVLIHNEFDIQMGIEKGAWNRAVRLRINRKYPTINTGTRDDVDFGNRLYQLGATFASCFLPNDIRRLIKGAVLRLHRGNSGIDL